MTVIGRRVSLGALLEERAANSGNRPFLTMAGARLTFAEFNREVNRVAHGMSALGVGRGDPVALMLPNCLQFLLASYALKKLGAIEVTINRAFRGPGLVHVLNQAPAELLITGEDDIDAIGDVLDQLTHVRSILVVGDAAVGSIAAAGLEVLSFESVLTDREDNPGYAVDDKETASVLFTSGTTGRSKGCMLSHRYAVRQGELIAEHLGFNDSDCLYSPFPLYHFDAAYLTVVAALVVCARTAIGSRFSASGFWDEVREFDATVFDFMGATLAMLWKQPERSDDANSPARLAFGVPMPKWKADFERRFGLTLAHGYGMTDVGVVSYEDPTAAEPLGSCGKPHHPYQVRIFDENDDEVPRGTVGEIVVRTLEADVMMKGYWGMAEAALDVTRNLWFHTGDLGRFDEQGHLFFAGRKKDAIRRRGENISAYEIEEVLDAHPAIQEVAAIGIPSELTEEDVGVFVVLNPDAELDAEELREYCRHRMARFMVPEHVEFVGAIPKTATGKVEKYKLLERRSAAPR